MQIHPDPIVLVTAIDTANFDKINEILQELPLTRLSLLEQQKLCEITAAYKVDAKYGVSVMELLNDTYSTYLYKRMNRFFNQYPNQFDQLQNEVKNGAPSCST